MRNFVRSRVFLTLVAFVLVATSVVVAQLDGVRASRAQSSATFSVVFSSVVCSSPLTLLSLDKGEKVSGTAELKSDGSGQAGKGENLLLQETNGPFTQTIPLDSGSQPFSFTAAANHDALAACITGKAESGSVATVTVSGPASRDFSIFNSSYFRFILGLR